MELTTTLPRTLSPAILVGVREAASAGFVFAIVTATGLAQGGYFPESWGWAALGCLLVAFSLLVLGAEVRLSRLEWTFVVSLLLLLAWTAASTAWTLSAGRTVQDAQRTALYVSAVLAVLIVARGSAHAIAVGVSAAATCVSGYALATRLLPDVLGYDGEGLYRLARPLGYWNGVAVLAAVGVLLSAGLVAQGRHRLVRAGAAASLPVLARDVVLHVQPGRMARARARARRVDLARPAAPDGRPVARGARARLGGRRRPRLARPRARGRGPPAGSRRARRARLRARAPPARRGRRVHRVRARRSAAGARGAATPRRRRARRPRRAGGSRAARLPRRRRRHRPAGGRPGARTATGSARAAAGLAALDLLAQPHRLLARRLAGVPGPSGPRLGRRDVRAVLEPRAARSGRLALRAQPLPAGARGARPGGARPAPRGPRGAVRGPPLGARPRRSFRPRRARMPPSSRTRRSTGTGSCRRSCSPACSRAPRSSLPRARPRRRRRCPDECGQRFSAW